jgi:hypothetical protein
MRWAFAVAAGLCLVVLLLATRLPARPVETEAEGPEVPDVTDDAPVADRV